MVTCCAVHSFIRKDCGGDDPLFYVALRAHYGQEWINVSRLTTIPIDPYVLPRQLLDQSLENI